MYIVLNSKGSQVFRGFLSDATKFVLDRYGPLDMAIRGGIRIVPCSFTETAQEGNS